jgi:hypothetical protein
MKLFLITFFILFYPINADLIKICYNDDFGCFTITSPFFDPLTRPLTVLPQSPKRISTKFILYTRNSPTDGVQISSGNCSEYLNIKAKTQLIIHGFLQNGLKQWVIDMKNSLLKIEDSNVISVDWSKGNFFPYTQATANTRIVGVEVAKLISSYIIKGLITADNVHIIGHSLGAHIAGYAGERISPKIGRITGLDPAGLYFENTDPTVRLDPTDAKFVDVIHSDGTTVSSLIVGYGLLQNIGHVDFYPNGGHNQPNCPITTNNVISKMSNFFNIEMKQVEDLVACGHISAVYFFTDSILNSECQYTAFTCKDINEFKTGNCISCSSKGCNRMGFYASSLSDLGVQYLKTQPADSAPYCLHHYQLSIKSADYKTNKHTSGKYSITLKGSLGISNKFVIDDNKTNFKEGLVINRLVEASRDLGEIEGAVVSFTKPFCFYFSCWNDVDGWSFEVIRVTNGDSHGFVNLCPKSGRIISGGSVEYVPCLIFV